MVSPLFFSSLPSAMASRLPHLHSFVVLSTKTATHRVISRRNSLTSSCSTASNSSDDESDPSDINTDDCCIVYESYAAVTKRSNRSRACIRWSDLQLVQDPDDTAVPLAARRRPSHHTRDGKRLELLTLELCFEFLTLEELLRVAQVGIAFCAVVTSSKTLLTGLYSRHWRAKRLPETYMKLSFTAQLTLCAARRVDATYELSTRSTVTHLLDGKYHVVNNSMLRNFEKGAIDSICGLQKLSVLSCARALHKMISYYEVRLTGCGSVGLASISDATTRSAYGFGFSDHVGWKGVSYGYHGNDGSFVFNDGAKPYGGEWGTFGPPWGRAASSSSKKEKDESKTTFTVGCGLDAATYQIFFTLNGKMIEAAPKTVLSGDYAAAVSLHVYGDEAVINAGASPFLFDIEAFCASP